MSKNLRQQPGQPVELRLNKPLGLRQQLRVIRLLFKLRLSHMMMYRLSFFGAFFVDGCLFVIQLMVFSAIYSYTPSIGGWSQGEMYIFIGTFSLINALNMVLFFFGTNDIPDKIVSGRLDHYLTKPMNPLLRLTFESINPGSVPLVILSLGIVGYGVSLTGADVTGWQVAGYGLLVVIMTVLWYDVGLILRTLPFFVASAGNITRLEELLDLCMKIPGTLFKGAFKVLFYAVLPYGIMSTIPSRYIAGKLGAGELLYGLLITALFTVLALRLWKLGLKHYKSASS